MATEGGNITPPFPEFLAGFSFSVAGDQYRLERLLGGGSTAVVFRGVMLDGRGEPSRQLAFKFARNDERYRDALIQESNTLRVLERAEQKSDTHYFPRVLLAPVEIALPTDRRLAGQSTSLLVLGQELAAGRGVHDLVLDFPDLRLPERLALEIGRQYAEVLTILHGAGLSCVDRKSADLFWQSDTTKTAPSNQPPGIPGKLMVVDWNVTDRATPGAGGTMALDLFRFGLLWHRMLLGSEPRFRQTGRWQLEEPLPRHPAWRELSFGTEEILLRLLHPAAGLRYAGALDLLRDFQRQVELWDTKENVLAAKIGPVWERYTKASDPPALDELRAALAAVDIRRVRGSLPPGLDKTRRGLRQAVTEAPFARIKEAMKNARWGEAREQALRFVKEGHEAAVLLQIERYGRIAAQAEQQRSSRGEVNPLLNQSDRLFRLDAPDFEPDPGGSEVEQADAERNDVWAPIRQSFREEFIYRLRIPEARSARDNGKYQDAHRLFGEVISLRRSLNECSPSMVSLLDQLYGDPTPESRTVESVVDAGRTMEEVVTRALAVICDDSPLFPDALASVADALRCEPENPYLIRLYRLLEAEKRYRCVSELPDLFLVDHALNSVHTTWEELVSLARDPSSLSESSTDLRYAVTARSADVEGHLLRRRSGIGERRSLQLGRNTTIAHLEGIYSRTT